MPKEHPNTTTTRRHFNDMAADYDRYVVSRIEAYGEAHQVIAGLAGPDPEAPLRILELGVGTGNLTRVLLRRFPNSVVSGFDISEQMLKRARRKLAFAGDRVGLHCADITAAAFQGPFDVVASAIALHHVPPRSKPRLFGTLLQALAPGGSVAVADVFNTPSPQLRETYQRLTAGEMERAGADSRGYMAAQARKGRSGGSEARLEDYLRWLRQAGAGSVDCVWKFYNLGVVYGRKE